jgi:hypothetical protein
MTTKIITKIVTKIDGIQNDNEMIDPNLIRRQRTIEHFYGNDFISRQTLRKFLFHVNSGERK